MVNVQYPVEFDTLLGPSTDCDHRRYPGASVTCALLDPKFEEILCNKDECPLTANNMRWQGDDLKQLLAEVHKYRGAST